MSSPSRRSAAARKASQKETRKWLFLLGGAILFAIGLYFGIEIGKPPPRPDFGRPPEVAASEPAPKATSTPATKETEPNTPSVDVVRQPPPGDSNRPRIALVIDDLGRSLQDLDTLAALGVPITYAVLPFETKTSEVVAELRRRQEEILCHLPMEAKGGANPGPGALLLSMSQGELRQATAKALDAVPGAVGVNNHMGSGIAANQEAIATVVSVVGQRELYFLDSRTTHETLGYSIARQMGIPAAERQVFLDTKRDRDFIRGQFQKLLQEATRRGGAIAIAHPYGETLDILAEEVPKALDQGFDFVPTSTLLVR